MTKYRIVKYQRLNKSSFKVEKKVWWFPFWFNWLNIDAYTTGFFDTEQEAMNAIEWDKSKTNKTIINV